MSNIKRYNLFILISTFARNIVEIFSIVLLYKFNYSLKQIFLFYAILYFTGAVTSLITIYLTKKIKPKTILITSSIIFSISFYFMSIMNKNIINLIIFSIIYAIGSYSYHTLRHYFAIKSISKNKEENIGNILIFTNIASSISPLIASIIQDKLSLLTLTIVIIIISIIGIIPLLKLNIKEDNSKIKLEKIEKNKLLFFILEQSKVLYVTVVPLYIFIYINNKITYVGIWNLFMTLASCIFIYFYTRKKNIKKYFKYLNILFCLILVFKLNINNKYLFLLLSLFEGFGIKQFEIISTLNMYNIKENINIKGYLIVCEIIFCLTRSLLCLIIFIFNDLKIYLYIMITLILLVGFIKRKISYE